MKTDEYSFTDIKKLNTTPVKNQAYSSTCWSFATISFVETELLRMGKEQLNLSEMFVVRKTYPRKARQYVRMHGTMGFGATSLSGDALRAIREHGIVPESVYSGMFVGGSKHNHREMDAVLKAALDAIISNKGQKLSKVWPTAIDGILNAYLGEAPETFDHNGKSYTPIEFTDELDFNPDDYIELTSYTHQPFYKMFSLAVPDNWSLNEYFNLPLDEFMLAVDNAIQNGYSLAWDGDITEKSFNQKQGVAILPLKELEDRTAEERDKICFVAEPEKEVTQEYRQECYDDHSSTDDHLMHVTGMAKDQNGTKFYIVKNSWGFRDNKYGGFIYMSESYFRSKTVSVMVHKEALPTQIAARLPDVKS